VEQARNQSHIVHRKSISCNTANRQSYHLQAMLTGEALKGPCAPPTVHCWTSGREWATWGVHCHIPAKLTL